MVLQTQALVCQVGVRRYIPLWYYLGMKWPPTRLRELRDAKGLTQQQLADAVIPVSSQPQIDRLEKSQRELTTSWANRLAQALECHWTDLYVESPAGADAPTIISVGDLPAADMTVYREAEANVLAAAEPFGIIDRSIIDPLIAALYHKLIERRG